MPDIIDITVPLKSDIPTWPGSVGIQLTRTMCLEKGDSTNVSRLDCDVHTGTHVDAPSHVLKSGITVEQLPLDVMIGPCFVAYLPDVSQITPAELARLKLPAGTNRLLLHTDNSKAWKSEAAEFKSDYAALTDKAARWIVDQKIKLIGVDYLSVQRYGENSHTHKILLEAGVVILEGLMLADVQPGSYELICLPVKLVGADGAPARVVLRSITETREQSLANGAGL